MEASRQYQVFKGPFQALVLPKLTIIGGDQLPSGGYLIAANHIDFLDGFFIAAAIAKLQDRPVYFLTKTNNYWWSGQGIQIPQEHQGEIVGRAIAELRTGKIICNFPEGRRNPAAKILPGKTGTVRIAVGADVSVVPIGLTCPAGKTMAHSLQNFFSLNEKILVNIGRPLRFDRSKDLRQQTAELMQAIAVLAGKSV